MAKKLYFNQTINDLLQKHGQVYFRMGLYHLLDCGIRNLIDEEEAQLQKEAIIAEEKQKELENEEKRKRGERAGISIMTAEFKCMLIDIAHELAKVGITDLLKWVQDNLYFSI